MSTTQEQRRNATVATQAPSAAPQDKRPAIAKVGPESAFGAAVKNRGVLGAGGMLALQAAAGNRAVAGLVQAKQARSSTNDSARVHEAAKLGIGAGGELPVGIGDATPGGPSNSGRPLPPDALSEMGRAFGTDFSGVRIHEDDRAEALGADAFTRGQDIHFAPGRYDPQSRGGRELLGHELAHVVQQGEGRVAAPTQAKGLPVNQDASLEREADELGAKAAAGEVVHSSGTAGTPGRTAPIQCAIAINGERITHASRKLNALYNGVVVPVLEENNLKTYGVKSKLVQFVRDNDAAYADPTGFLHAFLPWLALQTRAVKGGKTTPVLKHFSVMSMGRPSWPEALKAKKGVEAGDNVRHVVRNATLKRALDLEYAKVPAESRKAYFTQLSQLLEIEIASEASLPDVVRALYKAVYLNADNLFSGDGPTNQVIGFSADAVTTYGEELLADGDGQVSLIDVHHNLMTIIDRQAGLVKAHPGQIQLILSNINETVLEALRSLLPDGVDGSDRSQLAVSSEAAGDLVANIGLNFGFDLIDGRVDEDQDNIGERQGRLIWVERALQVFIASGGTNGSLVEIFGRFLED